MKNLELQNLSLSLSMCFLRKETCFKIYLHITVAFQASFLSCVAGIWYCVVLQPLLSSLSAASSLFQFIHLMLLIGHQFVKIEAMSCVCVSVQSWFEHVTWKWVLVMFCPSSSSPPPPIISNCQIRTGVWFPSKHLIVLYVSLNLF